MKREDRLSVALKEIAYQLTVWRDNHDLWVKNLSDADARKHCNTRDSYQILIDIATSALGKEN